MNKNQNLSENLRSGLLAYPQGRELPSPGWYPLLDLKLRFHMFLMSEEAVQGSTLFMALIVFILVTHSSQYCTYGKNDLCMFLCA